MGESPYIHNVSMQNFQNLVLEKSINKPVLVDFWADWCQPCQTIMPMLAKLAEEYDGKFELAKVNADQEQELAAHFGIKSLPTMKLFYQGQIVDESSVQCLNRISGQCSTNTSFLNQSSSCRPPSWLMSRARPSRHWRC